MNEIPNVLIVQRVIPDYRVEFFERLSKNIGIKVLYGRGTQSGAQKNSSRLAGGMYGKCLALTYHARFRDSDIFFSFFPFLFFRLVRENPTLIVTEGTTNLPNNIYVYIYSRLFGVPVILWDAGRDDAKEMGAMRKLFEKLLIAMQKRSAAIMSYTDMGKRYFIRNGIAAEKIHVMNNSTMTHVTDDICARVDAIKNELDLNGKTVLLIIGALERRKLLDKFVQSISNSELLRDGCALVFIGDGAERHALESLVQQYRLNARFLGEMYDGKSAYFKVCDALVLPGWATLAIVEALSFNRPVFTANHGGPEYGYVQHGVNGLIHEKADMRQLIVNLEKFVNGIFVPRFDTTSGASLDTMVQNALTAIKSVYQKPSYQ